MKLKKLVHTCIKSTLDTQDQQSGSVPSSADSLPDGVRKIKSFKNISLKLEKHLQNRTAIPKVLCMLYLFNNIYTTRSIFGETSHVRLSLVTTVEWGRLGCMGGWPQESLTSTKTFTFEADFFTYYFWEKVSTLWKNLYRLFIFSTLVRHPPCLQAWRRLPSDPPCPYAGWN